MKGFFKSRPVLTLVMLVLVVGVTVVTLTPGFLQLRPHSAKAVSADRVLILAGTVTGGSSSIEASEATADGLAVDVVDATTWSSMTAAQFASYRAIILGDPTCSGITPDIDAAAANSKVWGPTINGNIVIFGTDPVYHASQGGETVTRRGVDFAVNQVGKTGAYITLSCYYHGTAANTPVPLLDGVGAGGFTVTGVGCYNNAHIVAESPALSGLTDADISNWSCSVHEAFQTWASGLIPLAIAKDFDSSFTASDGTQGPPYILAGGDIRSFPLSITPLNDSAAAGSSHTVTAQLLDGVTRNPLAGAKIGFQVTAGPNAGVTGVCSPVSCVTGTSGQVSWTYTSNSSTGSDTIKAFYDMNNNGTADVGEPQTTAGMQWTASATCQDAAFIAVSGSGQHYKSDTDLSISPQLRQVYNAMMSRLAGRKSVRVQVLNYPALSVDVLTMNLNTGNLATRWHQFFGVNLPKYLAGKDKGVAALSGAVTQVRFSCPNQKIVLAGYSQGAMVVHEFLEWLAATNDAATKSAIRGVVLIADPERVRNSEVVEFGDAAWNEVGICDFPGLSRFTSCTGALKLTDVPAAFLPVVTDVCFQYDIVCDTGELFHDFNVNTPSGYIEALNLGKFIHTDLYQGSPKTRTAGYRAANLLLGSG